MSFEVALELLLPFQGNIDVVIYNNDVGFTVILLHDINVLEKLVLRGLWQFIIRRHVRRGNRPFSAITESMPTGAVTLDTGCTVASADTFLKTIRPF